MHVLTIKRDEIVKVCNSKENLTFISNMSHDEPYHFQTYQEAEWAFWEWKKRTGSTGWWFEVRECF